MDEIKDVAKQFGELNLTKYVGNYASEVYIGTKYIFKHYTLKQKLEKKDYLKERLIAPYRRKKSRDRIPLAKICESSLKTSARTTF